MDDFFREFTPQKWEVFCEDMLRRHYGTKNFWVVPAADRGDLGLEFFTADGTIFQCYFPEILISMEEYKKRVKNKINTDTNKLKKYESKISELVDDIKINQWVLLIPENKSKDFIKYCVSKKRRAIKENLKFIDKSNFTVKIETADSYKEAKIYAKSVSIDVINIPLGVVTADDQSAWCQGNSEFHSNIQRKSNTFQKDSPEKLKNEVIHKYIQMDKFLEKLREDFPDIYEKLEDSARAQLENMRESSVFAKEIDIEFIKNILESNKSAFQKLEQYLSANNSQLLAFGYMSKWMAECFMDFEE